MVNNRRVVVLSVGCYSRLVRVLGWIVLDGYRIGARVSVNCEGLGYEKMAVVSENRVNCLKVGESYGRVLVHRGMIYDLSMRELVSLADCLELNFTFSNCKLDDKILDKDENKRVIYKFREIGEFWIPDIDIGSVDTEGNVVEKDWSPLFKRPEEMGSEKGEFESTGKIEQLKDVKNSESSEKDGENSVEDKIIGTYGVSIILE